MKALLLGASTFKLDYALAQTKDFKKSRDLTGALIGYGYISEKFHLNSIVSDKRVHLKYVCDVDRDRLDKAKADLKKKGRAKEVDFVEDYRRILQDKSVDFVLIAVPHHWHAKMAIEFIKAKKHIYLEKPGCLTFEELVTLEREYLASNVLVQIGTQNRSNRSHIEGIKELQSGSLGKPLDGLALTYLSKGDRVLRGPNEDNIPPHINLNQWFGPAPKSKSIRRDFHEDWASFWNYSMGVPERTVHRLDLIQWAMGFRNLSSEVTTFGTRVRRSPNDCGQTPNLQFSFHKNKEFSYSNEFYIWRDDKKFNLRKGIIIATEKGHFCMTNLSRSTFFNQKGELQKVFGPKKIRHNHVSHFRNFISSIITGNRSSLNADLLEGLKASGSSILENLSYHQGREVNKNEFIKALVNQGSSASKDYLSKVLALASKKDPLIVGQKVSYIGHNSLLKNKTDYFYPISKNYPESFPLITHHKAKK